MKKNTFILALFFGLFSSSGFSALAPSSEVLIYKLTYMGFIPMGKTQIEFDGKRIFGSYRSPSWLSLFFKVQGETVSMVDEESLLPFRYEENYKYTGHPEAKNVLEYDQKNGRISINRNGEKEEKDIPNDVVDPLSAIYRLRTQSWGEGKENTFKLVSHQSVYNLHVQRVKEEKVKGQNTVLLKGTLHRADLMHLPPKMEAWFWITQDEKQLPLKVKLKTKFGYLQLNLAG